MAYRKRNKKRIRSVKVLEAEILDHDERYKKHLLWNDRNEKYFKRRQHYCSKIADKIWEIKKTEQSYKKTFGLFQSNEMTEEATKKLHELELQMSVAEKKALLDVPALDFPFEEYPNNRRMYSDWTDISYYLARELEQARLKEAKKEKARTLKARVAQADNKTRKIATSVKLRLPQNHLCPYCGNHLGDNPHADHIYPVSRGGLSTLVNMVYACASCNKKKKANTLKMFIDEFELDRSSIENRLTDLGKEF